MTASISAAALSLKLPTLPLAVFAAARARNKRALLLAAGLALNTGAHRAATAAEEVFTVGNYPVEARADNAVAAKTKAMADGQQAAFRSLLKRLVPVTAYPRLRQQARDAAFPKPEDNFRWRYFGLFYVAPAQSRVKA